MRPVRLLAATLFFFATAGVTFAQSPFAGTWKINPELSQLAGDTVSFGPGAEDSIEYKAGAIKSIGSLGLPLEGTSVFLMEIGPDGALLNLELERSAGAAVLDHTAADMIEGAAPFPPPPRESFPGPTAVLEATIAIYPGSGSALTR